MQNNREFLYAQIGDNALRGRTNPVRIPYWADSVPVMGLKKRKRRRTYTHIRNTVNLGYEKAHGREFLYAQIGDDALRGRTNPVRIPYWADSVTVLSWQKRKLSRIVSNKPIQF